jgi:hypothetical protein
MGFTARNQGPKHNYTYKNEVYSVKRLKVDLGWKNQRRQGFN